jgi:hypothetical protein
VHPPLDLLIRSPIAQHTASEWPLRLPSALAAIVALGALAWWLRHRQVMAVMAVAAFAASGFQLTFAWEARMYAVMALVGVLAAVGAHRWVLTESTSAAVQVSAVLLVGLFVSESAMLLAAGLLLLPGLRRDRTAWTWRLSIGAACGAWVVLWGPSFLHQLHGVTAVAPVEYTTPGRVLRVLNELVDYMPALSALVTAAVIGGGIFLWREDRSLFRVWMSCFVAPFALAAVVGIHAHLFWVKTMAVASWGPALALGALCQGVARRWRLLVVPVAAAVALVILPSTLDTLRHPQGPYAPTWWPAIQAMRARLGPGDAVASSELGPPILWYVVGPRSHREIGVRGWAQPAYLTGSRPWSGRVWTIEGRGRARGSTCAPAESLQGWMLECVVVSTG